MAKYLIEETRHGQFQLSEESPPPQSTATQLGTYDVTSEAYNEVRRLCGGDEQRAALNIRAKFWSGTCEVPDCGEKTSVRRDSGMVFHGCEAGHLRRVS